MNSSEKEKVNILNQITKIIDDKASVYRKNVKMMPNAQYMSEKKIIGDLIEDAIKLASELKTVREASDILQDLNRLKKDISGLKPLK